MVDGKGRQSKRWSPSTASRQRSRPACSTSGACALGRGTGSGGAGPNAGTAESFTDLDGVKADVPAANPQVGDFVSANPIVDRVRGEPQHLAQLLDVEHF